MWSTQEFKLICFIIIINLIPQKIRAEKECPLQESILPCRCLIRGNEYQIWCSHSNLSSVLESLKLIGQYINTPIDELILENNHIPSLPSHTFSSLKILRLMLRYNTLERVSNDWLYGLETSLLELFIVEPKLSNLPQMSLKRLKHLKAITLKSKMLKKLPFFSGLPLLKYVQLELLSLTEISPSNFKYNPSLEKLHIQSSPKLKRLEANLFDDMPKLDLVNITYCGIDWVHPRVFGRLPTLKELSLIGNKITDPGMIGRASRELPKLEILKLDYNYIGALEEATFVDMPTIKNIYLSNNLIGDIKQGAFHRLTSLKTLDISRNTLKKIQRQSFLQPIFLEELNLKDNDIADVVQVKFVLEDLPKLVYLDLSYNKLESIPFRSLTGHSTLEELNLGYNRLQSIDKEAFMVMPALRELTLTNNSIAESLRVPFWNLPALKGLDMSKNYLRRLEHGFLDNVEILRRVDLSLNHLNFIDPETFLATSFLEHINISFNGLKMLHPATFRHLTHLYELDVSRNRLKVLVPGLPGNIEHLHLSQNEISTILAVDLQLPSLRLLDLSENRIESLDKGQLRNLGKLKKLYLNSNYLRTLAEGSLSGLKQLEILDLSDNRIFEINPLSMKSIGELKFLNIANNQLPLIGPAMLRNAKNLKMFNASQNQLGEILLNTFVGNSKIENIDLSRNLLVKIPETLYGLQLLKKLDLSRNRLKNVNSTILSSLLSLREIKLSKNFIQLLEVHTFNNLKYLKTIHLDENDIMLLESNFIKSLPVLKLLKMDKNKIEEIPRHAFSTLLSLQNLELQENNIRFIHPRAFYIVPQLLTLNLSKNEIFKVEDAGLKSLKSLEQLDMSFNKITKISINLDDLEWLVELLLKNNYICEIDKGVFKNIHRLKVLDLRNNKLISFPEVAIEKLKENTAQIDVDVEGNPLDCSCDLLWLKTWLQENSQNSPRCSDGTLLSEISLSPQDCPADRQSVKLFSGCDTELLNSPDFQSPQAFSKFSSIRNFSLNGKNNLAPSPQESEYFYDDYIDYPFNSSLVNPNEYLAEKNKETAESYPTVNQTGENKTGNTPVLYAASSKRKQNLDIPSKVPDSPSTSGFTFFGIPLPPLNLNNMFGKKTNRATPQEAERKNAIMNIPRIDKQQPTPKIAERIQPPLMPEFQGGFIPILPGNGGFKPIPDPRLILSSTRPTITFAQQPLETSTGQISLIHKNYNLELISNKKSLNISSDRSSVVNNRNKKSQLADEDVKVNGTKLESISNIQYSNIGELHNDNYPANKLLDMSKKNGLEKSLTTESVLPIYLNRQLQELTTTIKPKISENNKEKLLVPLTSVSQIESNFKENQNLEIEIQTNIKEENILLATTVLPNIVTEKEKIKENVIPFTGSFLSTIVAPEIQQSYFKHTAKSRITKVASPHGSSSAPLLSSLEVSDTAGLSPVPQTKEETIITLTQKNDKNNWYYENYNKRSLEPFIAKIVNTNCGEAIVGKKLVLWLMCFVVLVYK